MNREDIFRMAQEVELINKDYDLAFLNKYTDKVERFATLVASAAVRETSAEYRLGWNDGQIDEREACAEIADRLPRIYRETEEAHYRLSPEPFKPSHFGFDFAELKQAEAITHAIRARGQA